ncbi:hypothetical protein SODALDRAFT_316381 [Sodiomyces alkalinus F11]|uniref:Mitochondrial intermembrane space import and assembly protein 40 n=1 Tax=Sodiomyces alkalinus (strain CBS 110278 / VKM F-3762 / F11) TaxID=1314773 RepID=A0A3N2PNJ1_SODAK|nr:hypothetical protein SODALDRAFT_316381 [Sodiomyces alkalinus F11]ROT36088.1 hypothetical protein SODALDRAFT_316381 [Sodiomyces alkalinus F11]
MYRQAVRSTPRAASALRHSCLRSAGGRRFASTAPTDKPRTWKSTMVRWGLAAAAVYYYNTSPIFAEEPQPPHTVPAPPQFPESDLKTVDTVIEEKRQKKPAGLQAKEAKEPEPTPTETSDDHAGPAEPTETRELLEPGSPEALEEEAGQQGAFNPETGEINWDCPCLGGMAHGPCGEEFKAAFSCFVYSKEEPKGMDCIDKFQGMQECFKKYPEVYDAELAGEDGDAESAAAENTDGDDASLPESATASSSTGEEATNGEAPATPETQDRSESGQAQNTFKDKEDRAPDATDVVVKTE